MNYGLDVLEPVRWSSPAGLASVTLQLSHTLCASAHRHDKTLAESQLSDSEGGEGGRARGDTYNGIMGFTEVIYLTHELICFSILVIR